jgi:hypothetical protein
MQVLAGPECSRSFRLQGFKKSAHEGGNVVSPTHRPPLPPGNIPGTHFCKRLSRPQGHSAAGRIMSMKNSNDTMGNRSRDLPVCSAVPQPLRHRVPQWPSKVKINSASSWFDDTLTWRSSILRKLKYVTAPLVSVSRELMTATKQ